MRPEGGGVMSEIIKFPSRESLPAPEGRTGRGGRYKRNALRRQLTLTSVAMVQLNKIDPQHTADDIETIRRGVVAARVLADELARLAARVGCTTEGQSTSAAKGGHSYVDFLRNFRAHFEQALANGKAVDRIFDDLDYGAGIKPATPQRLAEDEALARDRAFRELDEQVSDLDRWADLTASSVGDCVAATVETSRELGLAYLVVNHFREFVKDFKTKYYRAWQHPDGEVA